MPKWPPENFDCSEQLKSHKLRVVNVADWKKEPNSDENNFIKCFELPGFKYVFVDCNNKTYDFRPNENKPSFNNLINFPEIKLWEYLKNALFQFSSHFAVFCFPTAGVFCLLKMFSDVPPTSLMSCNSGCCMRDFRSSKVLGKTVCNDNICNPLLLYLRLL